MSNAWDGNVLPYIPAPDWAPAPEIPLNGVTESEIDPITYEVIRHNLWNVNLEHAATIIKVSGSQIAVIGHDFNPSIMTERGEFVFIGPYVQYLNSPAELAIKFVLEHFGSTPGIFRGDMFLTNDPWIAANHQSDIQLVAPIFVDDGIFAWVSSALHTYDVGGVIPGSFVSNARDIFDEPTPLPPIKIVEGNEIRADMERLYLRHTRMPQLVGLDLRAQIAGCTVATNRILALVERYGAGTVKAVMRKVLDDAEAGFLTKLAEIPDGTWRERSYVEAAGPGDRGIYRGVLTMTKEGDRLIFENEGSEPAVGSIGVSYSAWRGGIIAALAPYFSYDQLYAVGGLQRHIEFRPTPNTYSCASWPSAVSCTPPTGLLQVIGLANNCIAKMLRTSTSQRSRIMANNGPCSFPIVSIAGVDQWGAPYGTIVMDALSGALGAFADHDGISTGGPMWDPMAQCFNVEENEQYYPILYLYRREQRGTAGAGLWRGGNGGIAAFVPWGTEQILHSTTTGVTAIPNSLGIFGGHPGSPNRFTVRRDSDVREAFEDGRLPQGLDQLKGTDELLGPKATGVVLDGSTVHETIWCGGAGFGDPLTRDPALVAVDVEAGELDVPLAQSQYGVVLTEEGVDTDATAELRRRLLQSRRDDAVPPARSEASRSRSAEELREATQVSEALGVLDGSYVCLCCGHGVAAATSNYKLESARRNLPIQAANPMILDTSIYIDEEIQFREYLCPSCGALFDTEIARASEEPLWDVALSVGRGIGK